MATDCKTLDITTCSEDTLVASLSGCTTCPIDLPEIKAMAQLDKFIRAIVRTKVTPRFYLSKYDHLPDHLVAIPGAKAIWLAAIKRGLVGLLLRQVELGIEPSEPVEKAVLDALGTAIGTFVEAKEDKVRVMLSLHAKNTLIEESCAAFERLCGDLLPLSEDAVPSEEPGPVPKTQKSVRRRVKKTPT